MAGRGWENLLGLLLFSLLAIAAAKDKSFRHGHRRKGEGHDVDEYGEEEDEKEKSLAGYTSGLCTIGGFLLVTILFYLINNKRTVVRKIIWEVQTNTISIFCAIFIYQTSSHVINKALDWFLDMAIKADWSEETRFNLRRYFNQGEVVMWYGWMFALLSLRCGIGHGMMFRLSIFKDKLTYSKDRNGVRFGLIFSHVAGFATMQGWGMVQTNDQFRDYYKSPALSLWPLLQCWGKWTGLLIVLGMIRRHIKYRKVQFWQLGTKVKLHYPVKHERYRSLHGKDAILKDYDASALLFTVRMEGPDGSPVIKKVRLDHVGIPAVINSDASEAKSLITEIEERSQTLVRGLKKDFKKVLRKQTTFVGSTRGQSFMHEIIAGNHEVVDDDMLKKGDEVVVLCSHHFHRYNAKRLIDQYLVVQGMHDTPPTNVRRSRIDLKGVTESSPRSPRSPGQRSSSMSQVAKRVASTLGVAGQEGDPFAQGPWGHHDPMVEFWEEQLEEGENDIVALATSFLLVQSLRYSIGGYLPNDEGKEKTSTLMQKNWWQVAGLYAWSFILFFLTYIHPTLVKSSPLLRKLHKFHNEFQNKRMEKQKNGEPVEFKFALFEEVMHAIMRLEEIIVTFFSFSMAWCFMFATQWALACSTFLTQSNRYTLNIWLANVVTLAVFATIGMLDPIITRKARAAGADGSNLDHFEKDMIKFCQRLGFLVGFTWEKCFDEALDEVAETFGHTLAEEHGDHANAKTYQQIVKSVVSILSLIILIPAWERFMIPMVDEKEYTLGFNVRRAVKNVAHNFDRESRREEVFKAKEEDLRRTGSTEDQSHYAGKAIKKMARHYNKTMKVMKRAFVVHREKSIRPTVYDLQNQEKYMERVLGEMRATLLTKDGIVECQDMEIELQKVMKKILELTAKRQKLQKAKLHLKFEFKPDLDDSAPPDPKQENFEKQRSAGGDSKIDSDADSAEEDEESMASSDEEEDSHAKVAEADCCNMVTLIQGILDGQDASPRKDSEKKAQQRRKSKAILERAEKLRDEYKQLSQDMSGLRLKLQAKTGRGVAQEEP